MSNMKLIMEGWRQYNDQRTTVPMVLIENGELICFDLNERLRSLNESNNSEEINILFEKWLVQTEAMLNENVITDFFGNVKDKAAKLTGQAKQFFTELVNDPYLTLSLQLWSFMQKVKNVGIKQITRIASIVTKINNARKQFKRKNPKLYAFLEITVKVAAAFLVVALLTAAADADVALAGVQGVPEAPKTILQPDNPAAQAVVGLIKQTNPDLANEVGRAIAEPQMTDYSSLTPEIQQAISDAVVSVNQAVEHGQTAGGSADIYANQALERFASEGRDILDNLAVQLDTFRTVGPPPDALKAQQLIFKLIQGRSGGMRFTLNQQQALLDALQNLDVLSPEDMQSVYDSVTQGDKTEAARIYRELALSMKP